jgi:HSP20 family protein
MGRVTGPFYSPRSLRLYERVNAALLRETNFTGEHTMAKDDKSTGQQSSGQQTGQTSGQGRQQTSEIAHGSTAQQGSGQGYQPGRQGQGGGSQNWQQPSGSSLQTRRTSPSSSPYGYGVGPYGGYGGGPFSMMRRISDEMDRLFENFGLGRSFFPSEFGQGAQSGGQQGGSSLWSPHVEVAEREGKIVISADLPGIKKEDVNVEVNPDSVVIQGQRQQEKTSNEPGYFHSERSYGSFYRTIPLPEGTDPESATATFRDGVLQIEVQAPKQQQRGRTLEITGLEGGSSRESGSESGQRGKSEQQR